MSNTIIIIFGMLTLFKLGMTEEKYTKHQALECFVQKAYKQCETHFNQCKENSRCQSQLKDYNKCSFYDNEHQKEHIFNGYCFRRWHQKAIQTRAVIDCMKTSCNLLYNSEIGTLELFQCMQSLFLQKQQLQCEQQCQEQMGYKLRDQYYEIPTKQLYSQPFRNKDAQNVVNLIVEECINEQGKVKKEIYQQQRIQEERRQQKEAKVQNTEL